MATHERKLRKRAGLKHPKIGRVKVGTPTALRAKSNALVWVPGYGWRVPSQAGSSSVGTRYTLRPIHHLFRRRSA